MKKSLLFILHMNMRTEVINLMVSGMTDVEARSELIPTYIPEGGGARGHLPSTKYYVKCSIYLSMYLI